MKLPLYKVTLPVLSEKPDRIMGSEWRKEHERDELYPDGFAPGPGPDPKKKPSG